MPGYDFRTSRLYVDAPLEEGRSAALDRGQAHYLTTVLRLEAGASILVFNTRDGEWRATLEGGKRAAALRIGARTRAQTAPADLHYLFAPLKSARLDYMVQKAVEMGASQLRPVLTRHGQIARVNLERMRANAIEAAEQCGILSLPEIAAPVGLIEALAAWQTTRHLVSAMKRPILPILSRRSPPSHVTRRLRSWSVRKAALPRTSARCCSNCRMWCGLRSARAPARRHRRGCRARAGSSRDRRLAVNWHFAIACQDEGWLMNLAWAVVTNETDILAVDAVDAGDWRSNPSARSDPWRCGGRSARRRANRERCRRMCASYCGPGPAIPRPKPWPLCWHSRPAAKTARTKTSAIMILRIIGLAGFTCGKG